MTERHPNRNSAKLNNHSRGFYCFGCDHQKVKPDQKCPVCGTRNLSNSKRRFSISTQRKIKETKQ